MPFLKILTFILIVGGFSPVVTAETVDELIALADSAQSKQQYRTALIHLKNATKQSPDNLGIRVKMVKLFIETGQGVQAEVELEKVAKLGAKQIDTAILSAKAKLLLGQFNTLIDNIRILDLPQTEIARLRAIQGHALFEQRKFKQARLMFQRALLLSPTELEVELGQAKVYKLDGDQQKEEQLVLSLLSRYQNNAEVLIVAGNYYRDIKEYDRALDLFNQAGEIQPSNVNVWFGIVRSQIGKGNYNDAKTEIQKVLLSYPEHQVGNYLLSVIAFEEGNYNRAKSAIEIVLKGEKRNFEALKLLSIIQFQLKEYSEADKNINKYLKYHPDNIQGLKTSAAIYLKRNQGSLALKILNKLENQDDAQIYSMIATAYIQLGNMEKSEFYINKSMQIAPKDSVIQRHIQRSKLAAGESLDLTFTDTDFNNFITKGYIPILNLLNQKKYLQAKEIIQGYMKTTPENAELHYLMGSTYLYLGKTESALIEFQRSLVLNPELIEARINLAKIFQQEGQVRKAKGEYRKVLRIQKNNDQAMLALAALFHLEENDEEMLKWLNMSRRLNSSSLASREVLERYYRKTGNTGQALKIAEEMIRIQPQNVNLLLKYANNQKALNRLDIAISTFKKIVEIKPELPSAWSGLGRLQYLYHQYDSAKKSFKKVLEIDADNLIATVILIQIDIKAKQFEAAKKKAKKLQKVHPGNPAGFDMLGDVYIGLNDPKNAIKQYQYAVNLKYSSEIYVKLHSAYNLNNQVDKGFDLLLEWIEKTPNDYELKELLAITYQRRKDYLKAIDLYEEIIKAYPNNDRALSNLALVNLKLNRPMSVEYAEMAFNVNPESTRNKDTLGWVLLKNYNLEKALELLKEAVDGSPGNADIRYHYAVALSETGSFSMAKNQLYLALSVNSTFKNRKAAEKMLKQLNSQ